MPEIVHPHLLLTSQTIQNPEINLAIALTHQNLPQTLLGHQHRLQQPLLILILRRIIPQIKIRSHHIKPTTLLTPPKLLTSQQPM